MFLGIDGCRAGWVAASINNNKIHISIYKNIIKLWENFKKADLIFIDIPIGLVDGHAKEKVRNCDSGARKLLGLKRGSSIFQTPSRETVRSFNYKDACKINKSITGRKISIQTWNIRKKIKEVDDFLSEIKKATIIIKESHPEICFYALSSNPMVFSKKNINGVFERKNILKKFIPDLDFILDRTFAKYNQNQANINDFLDCLALAISAKLAFKSGNISKIPITEQIDSKSFIMQISYFLAPGF
jgi:predicted RNase H-like nuclease